MRFIREQDRKVQIREEILDLLDDSEDLSDLWTAENIAISQMKKRLAKRYDTAAIFTPWDGVGADPRDPFIIMTVIDIAIYHLWTAQAPGKIPATRKERYQDAIDWLKEEGNGLNPSTDLPQITAEEYKGDVRLISKVPENHKW